ncbi:hypothetical protein CSKR_204062 [Clonorchis sinensis]|uniref:Uncharacterized protein n=1 Tax=Clonorchis sinensis TaxID=79923 RepID=A0A8T1M2W4_CLOSI|nr:hypothetical protein CSKR_204062 [Clonorchis sinensis]
MLKSCTSKAKHRSRTKNLNNASRHNSETSPVRSKPSGDPTTVANCTNCCEDFSTFYPFSFNIFLPGTKEVVREFVVSRHRLTTSGLRCRLRLGLNTFDTGCIYGKERVLRVEGMSKDEVIKCVDLLDSVFPDWKVWRRGKMDSDLI